MKALKISSVASVISWKEGSAIIELKNGIKSDVVYIKLLQLKRRHFRNVAVKAIAAEQDIRMRNRTVNEVRGTNTDVVIFGEFKRVLKAIESRNVNNNYRSTQEQTPQNNHAHFPRPQLNFNATPKSSFPAAFAKILLAVEVRIISGNNAVSIDRIFPIIDLSMTTMASYHTSPVSSLTTTWN